MVKKLVLCLVLLFCCVANVYANSAQTYWEGTNHTGVIQSETASPLVIKKEELTFTIDEFPSMYPDTVMEGLEYDAKVEAKYTMYNPSDMDIKVKMYFPFGEMQSYMYVYDYKEEKDDYAYDTSKYKITVNENEIEKRVRYTYKDRNDVFSLEKDLPKLADTYIEKEGITINTPVTKYVFKATLNETVDTYRLGYSVDWNAIENKKIPYMVNGEKVNVRLNDLNLIVGSDGMKAEEEFTIYYIGDIQKDPTFKIYKDEHYEEEIKGEVELIREEKMTFKDFAMLDYTRVEIQEVDWYNAFVESMQFANHIQLYSILPFDKNGLMRWYEYEIKIKAKETIEHVVNAPLYPGIDTTYETPMYSYTYLLTPASTFKEFNDLTIYIDTPYYLHDSSIEGFEKNEDGYVLELDTLPNKDLNFMLNEKEKANKVISFNNTLTSVYYLTIIVGPIILVISGIIFIVYSTKSKR